MPEPLTITAAALLFPYAAGLVKPQSRSNVLWSDTAASIQHVTWVVPPTGVSSVMLETHAPAAGAFGGAVAGGGDWMEVAHAVFGGSRSMTDDERAALDEFTWAELRS
jgi:hypothetical protein